MHMVGPQWLCSGLMHKVMEQRYQPNFRAEETETWSSYVAVQHIVVWLNSFSVIPGAVFVIYIHVHY